MKNSSIGLDSAYDSRENRKVIFNQEMKPNIKENPRNRKKILIKILKLQKQKRQFDKKYLKDFSFDNFKNRLNNILLEIN